MQLLVLPTRSKLLFSAPIQPIWRAAHAVLKKGSPVHKVYASEFGLSVCDFNTEFIECSHWLLSVYSMKY